MDRDQLIRVTGNFRMYEKVKLWLVPLLVSKDHFVMMVYHILSEAHLNLATVYVSMEAAILQ